MSTLNFVQRQVRIAVAVVIGIVVAVGSSIAFVPPASAASLPTGSWFSIVNQNSGHCVDARNGSSADLTAIQQYWCNNTNAQQFQFVPTYGGYYRVSNRNNGNEVWDVYGQSPYDTAKVELYSWWGGNNQQWLPISVGGGYYAFQSRNSGKCLDVPGRSFAIGLQLQQYSCNGTSAQSFLLISPGTQLNRGENDYVQTNWWGLKVAIDHGITQNVFQQYAAGDAAVYALSPLLFMVPGLSGEVGCLAKVIPSFASYDSGYGVYVNVPWPSIFYGCFISVSGQ